MRIVSYGLIGILALAWVGGCNAIVGIDKATYVDAGSDTSNIDAGFVDAGPAACTAGQKRCEKTQVCKATDNPDYGCADVSCNACSFKQAKAKCVGVNGVDTCAIDSCDTGYGDCDGKPVNGCETSFSEAKSCGQCNKACAVPNPFCAATGSGFDCIDKCLAPLTICNVTECVDTDTSRQHCGGCNKLCNVGTGPLTGNAKCSAGKCEVTCAAAYHACAKEPGCFPNDDPTHCGAACEVCTGGKTCSGDTCVCPPGSVDSSGTCVAPGQCSGVPDKTGCVTEFGTSGLCCGQLCRDICNDNANCGGCEIVCPGKLSLQCANGSCGGIAIGGICGGVIDPPTF